MPTPLTEIYRGYTIRSHDNEGYVILLDDKVVCSQPSLEFAYHWIDQQRRDSLRMAVVSYGGY